MTVTHHIRRHVFVYSNGDFSGIEYRIYCVLITNIIVTGDIEYMESEYMEFSYKSLLLSLSKLALGVHEGFLSQMSKFACRTLLRRFL